MKTCSRCGIEKHISEFQKRKASPDGLTASCKKCLSEYDKSRANLPHRVKNRIDYAATERGIESSGRAKKAWIEKNPTKRKAQHLVNNAIRDKKLFKEPCSVCGSSHRTHAHHDDYSKPLNVRWLCYQHHKDWHAEHGPGLNP